MGDQPDVLVNVDQSLRRVRQNIGWVERGRMVTQIPVPETMAIHTAIFCSRIFRATRMPSAVVVVVVVVVVAAAAAVVVVVVVVVVVAVAVVVVVVVVVVVFAQNRAAA